jgi:hypothetical protein
MRLIFFLLPAFALLFASCTTSTHRVSAITIDQQTIIMGCLGHQVGQEITIHGHKSLYHPMQDARSFDVDTVDGRALKTPVVIRVSGCGAWPDNTVATIRGHEVAVIRFEDIADANYGPDDPRFKPHQIIILFFKPTEIVEPKSLSLKNETGYYY